MCHSESNKNIKKVKHKIRLHGIPLIGHIQQSANIQSKQAGDN